MIFLFISAAVSPRLVMMLSSAEESGSSRPSRMNMRQKSFFVVGLCSSKTLQMPFRAWMTSWLCSV